MVTVDPASIAPHEFYRYMVGAIVPRPIAWVSSMDSKGRTNLAPFSFFNGVTANPPTLVISVVNNRNGEPKDTFRNIQETGEFVVNIVNHELCSVMVETAASLDHGISEFDTYGVESVASERVAPPRVAKSPICFECTTHQIVTVGTGALASNLIIGLIQLMHIDQSVLKGSSIDSHLLDAVGRMGGAEQYVRAQDLFDIDRPA